VHHKDGFYSYDAKYIESTSSELIIPAKVTKEQQVKLQQYAVKIFTSLKCHGLARVDFFVDDLNNKIYFNEINVLPGFTSISMYPMLWQASGLGYSVLLDKLIDLAILRHKIRSGLLTSYTK
jgi:D-alanine-D-alanine ligase